MPTVCSVVTVCTFGTVETWKCESVRVWKPARLIIRIVRRVPQPPESGGKKSIGLKKYVPSHLLPWKWLSALMYPWTSLWSWSGHFKFTQTPPNLRFRSAPVGCLVNLGEVFLSFLLSYFISIGFVGSELVDLGEVFLMISFHICFHREENASCIIQIYTNCNCQNVSIIQNRHFYNEFIFSGIILASRKAQISLSRWKRCPPPLGQSHLLRSHQSLPRLPGPPSLPSLSLLPCV